MSATILTPKSFRNAEPVRPVLQSQLDLALRLALGVAKPAPIRGGRTAEIEDINEAIDAIGRVHALYVDFVNDVMKELNSNLPVTDTVDTKEFLAGLVDLKNDLIGLLAITAERVMEDA